MFLSGFILLSVLHAQERDAYFLHTIERGQSLYSLSTTYGVSQADIIRLNPGAENTIYAGQTLKIPQSQGVVQSEIYHTIQQGETLYRLTVKYSISAKEICDENPGLSAENFKIGEVIRIPVNKKPEIKEENAQIQPAVESRCKDMHKVKRKETIFSVSRKYGITEDELRAANPELKDGMKRGQLLCIPYPKPRAERKQAEDLFKVPPSDRELFRKNKESSENISAIKAAIILPLTLEGENKNESAIMVEYYEGFLIAIDSLKRKGVSVDLYIYDSGSRSASLTPILAKEELTQMHVIFGPLYQEHVPALASFADEHHIRLVIPTMSKVNEVFQNPYIYQINTPQSYLYSEVNEHFCRLFPNANVIVLDMQTDESDKQEFINGLKQELHQKSIPVQVLNGNDLSLPALKEAINSDRDNIFIPTSGSDLALIKIIPQLKLLKMEEPDAKTILFGYPEWQRYTKDHLESFYELNTYFYSSFYTNNLLPSAINFINSYQKWYSKEMRNNYPKFGMLGFDTAFFFLSGLSKHGTGLENNLHKMNLLPIQTGFKFERVNNWGGFINKKVFFVHFTKEYELIKLDFD